MLVSELQRFQISIDCVNYQQNFHFKLAGMNNLYVCLNFMHVGYHDQILNRK